MKKTVIVLLSCLIFTTTLFAQEDTTRQCHKKQAKQYTPVKGDFALAVDMVPILRTLGTVFWGEPVHPIGFGGTPLFNQTSFGHSYPTISIIGKYMFTDKMALRVNLGALIDAHTNGFSVPDDAALYENPLSQKQVTDYEKNRCYGVSLNLGTEYRLGQRRVQGVFGADIIFGFYTASDKYTYGNAITEDNQKPTTHNDEMLYYRTQISEKTRSLLVKLPASYSIGAQVSAGVEYFVVPKIALGGQVNLSYAFSYGLQEYKEGEGFSPLSGKVEKVTQILSPAGWSHHFGTNNLGASLYVVFYF